MDNMWSMCQQPTSLVSIGYDPFDCQDLPPTGLRGFAVLARFNKTSRAVAALLRKDLDDDPLPLLCEGFVYCFTAPIRR